MEKIKEKLMQLWKSLAGCKNKAEYAVLVSAIVILVVSFVENKEEARKKTELIVKKKSMDFLEGILDEVLGINNKKDK